MRFLSSHLSIQTSTETAHYFFKNSWNSFYNGLNVSFQIFNLYEDYPSRRDPSNIPINESNKNLNPVNRKAKFMKLFRLLIKKTYSIH